MKWILTLMFLVGLYLPTSVNGTVNKSAVVMSPVAVLFVLLLILFKTKKLNTHGLILSLAGCVVLALATIFSPFNAYSYGLIPYYASVFMIFCLVVKDLRIGRVGEIAFLMANAANLLVCVLTVLKSETVISFLLQHYSFYYQDLMINMLAKSKPVLTFGSHSIAAFYLYLFFFMSLYTYKYLGKIIYLTIAVMYLVFIAYLDSNTSYAFLGIAVVQLLYFLAKQKKPLLYGAVAITLILSLFNLTRVETWIQSFYLMASHTLSSDMNGITGRYSSDGIMADALSFIASNFYRPIGIGYTDDIFLGDSGPVLLILRGTFLLLLLFYAAFYAFLRFNLDSKKLAAVLLAVFFLIDLGNPIFMYFRTLFVLPFVIVYLNHVRQKSRVVS